MTPLHSRGEGVSQKGSAHNPQSIRRGAPCSERLIYRNFLGGGLLQAHRALTPCLRWRLQLPMKPAVSFGGFIERYDHLMDVVQAGHSIMWEPTSANV